MLQDLSELRGKQENQMDGCGREAVHAENPTYASVAN